MNNWQTWSCSKELSSWVLIIPRLYSQELLVKHVKGFLIISPITMGCPIGLLERWGLCPLGGFLLLALDAAGLPSDTIEKFKSGDVLNGSHVEKAIRWLADFWQFSITLSWLQMTLKTPSLEWQAQFCLSRYAAILFKKQRYVSGQHKVDKQQKLESQISPLQSCRISQSWQIFSS